MTNLHGRVWTLWAFQKPAPSTRIWGMYEQRDRVVKGIMCMRGCCFNIDNVGACKPPTWWSPENDKKDKPS